MDKDFESRYKELIKKAEIIDESPVKGCIILKPYGYKIWERVREFIDERLKGLGYENMYFPMLIPDSLFKKQEDHYKHFVRESVRSKQAGDASLDEELIIRPTSEAIIYPSVKSWIKDKLPIRINQWCNIVRWEMLKENFPLIRDNEFLWHECHSFHADEEECDLYAKKVYDLYRELIQDFLAIPVFEGKKPERRKFAGAKYTLTFEVMLGNCKGLQLATSHSLGQNFSKAYDLKFNRKYVWQACSGLTTRVIGALAMVHSDDKGLVMPPNIAPHQVAIVNGDYKELDEKFRVIKDSNLDNWITKGVPIIISNNKIIRRDTMQEIALKANLVLQIDNLLREIQNDIYEKAGMFKEKHTFRTQDYSEFKELISKQAGFCIAGWCGSNECTNKISQDCNGSLRVINELSIGTCIYCGEKAKYLGVFGQSY